MTIRYYNIKSKPGVFGFAIKVNTEDKTIDSLNEGDYFIKIKNTENYTHFEMFERDYNIVGDQGQPVTLNRGSKQSLVRICMDNLGNIRLYEKGTYLSKEITKEEAEHLQKQTENHKLMQSWIL